MKCMICKHGETTDGFATVTLEKNGATIVFQKVPALVCDNCSEQYVSDTITASLLKDANAIIARGAKIDIREFGLVA